MKRSGSKPDRKRSGFKPDRKPFAKSFLLG